MPLYYASVSAVIVRHAEAIQPDYELTLTTEATDHPDIPPTIVAEDAPDSSYVSVPLETLTAGVASGRRLPALSASRHRQCPTCDAYAQLAAFEIHWTQYLNARSKEWSAMAIAGCAFVVYS